MLLLKKDSWALTSYKVPQGTLLSDPDLTIAEDKKSTNYTTILTESDFTTFFSGKGKLKVSQFFAERMQLQEI